MALLPNRAREERPWGVFERFSLNESTTVKIIRVRPHEKLSLQSHTKRSEFWYVLSGSGEVTIESAVHSATAGDEFEIPVGVAHRASAGDAELVFLEIALGEFVEGDETRLEDDYGRTSPTA